MSVKRFKASWREPPNKATDDYRGHNQIGEVVLASDYDVALAVLRQCVGALTACDSHFGHGAEYVRDALAAARKLLKEETT